VTWSAHLSLLFAELPPLERPAAAAAAGFAEVESWWPAEPEAWAAAVAAAGVGLACVNADGGDVAAGERGFLNVPERREWCLRSVAAAIAVARALGGRAVNVLAGLDTGAAPVEEQRAVAREVLLACAPAARAAGVVLVVEHLNPVDVPATLLPTPAAAAAFVRACDDPGIALLYDAYHAAMAGIDPVADAGTHAGLIGHAQYADAPGRGAPGTGTVDVLAFARALRRAGYGGPIGLELDPGPGGSAALAALPTP
jgi:hydroxypyruvate isomerase